KRARTPSLHPRGRGMHPVRAMTPRLRTDSMIGRTLRVRREATMGENGASANGSVLVGGDDMGLDQLIAWVGQQKLRPGAETARLIAGLARNPVRVARRTARLSAGLAQAVSGSRG